MAIRDIGYLLIEKINNFYNFKRKKEQKSFLFLYQQIYISYLVCRILKDKKNNKDYSGRLQFCVNAA